MIQFHLIFFFVMGETNVKDNQAYEHICITVNNFSLIARFMSDWIHTPNLPVWKRHEDLHESKEC